ncbi:uroporphyrinogen decarboxylase family protein [Acetobacterium tundrae]|uniref:Uroporphyrinogen decarboxylase (URO-D) domain-containing protein n=1 Tax=Acetobacterium tundrae TaxID=132932 RepID=A0ABR6WKB3_9FIRM|nr:uroporphyrinogen decarboxylase family protein [Acetobacterium tundrae]MBC3796876.1 hypothetical protein [Acetobacterium tundrae]
MNNRENALIALKGGKPQSVPCFFSACQIIPAAGTALECPPMGNKEGYDGYGVHMSSTEGSGGMFTPTPTAAPVLTDITLWKEQVKFPDYNAVNFESMVEQERQMFHLDPENFVQDLFCPNGMFERLHFLMGFEDALMAIMEEPEAVYDLAGAIADKKIEFIKKAAKYYQPDYFTYLDDYSHKTDLFMSKNTFREIFKPHLKRIVDAVKETDMTFKMHCCGKMEDLLDDFLEIGITAFDPVQCVNNIPVMKKKTLGRAGLMGGLDVQGIVDMGEVSEDALRKEVRRCIDTYAEGGGYMIYGASIHMFNPAAYEPTGPLGIIIDECAKYGKNYYQK